MNNDGNLWPLDVLLVINELKRRSRTETGSGLGTSGGSLPTSWQNPVIHEDVDANGEVAPIDVLQLINELNQPRILKSSDGLLPPITATVKPSPYLDVDGDGYLAPSDVLSVINRMKQRTGSGEGEGSNRDSLLLESVDNFWRDYGSA